MDEFSNRSKNDLIREIKSLRAVIEATKDVTPGGTDPRDAPGTIAGPGGPFDIGGVVLDLNHAVLLDSTEVAMVGGVRGGVIDESPALAMTLAGRINNSPDRASVIYLFNEDGAAAIISELLGLATRMGIGFAQRLAERLDSLPSKEDS
jgi:hypothetical protein